MFGYKIKWITKEIAVGPAPSTASNLETIRKADIQVILNLCAECNELHEAERKSGFLVYWLPIFDGLAPEMDELDEAVTWMKEQIDQGRKVLVHCRFGVGRTGTVIAAYLLKSGNTFKEVMKIMASTPASPTSRDQLDIIDKYANKLV